jgi:hypothetical protein
MKNESMPQLRGRIERARAAIIRDEQALNEATVGRDYSEVRNLGTHLENRRAYLGELLRDQTQLALGVAPE